MNPFLQGRKTVSTVALTAPKPSSAVQMPGMVRAPQPREQGPSVDVVKEGDKVVRLIVKCACGERLEIECLYSP
jgi:hypothetical protein